MIKLDLRTYALKGIPAGLLFLASGGIVLAASATDSKGKSKAQPSKIADAKASIAPAKVASKQTTPVSAQSDEALRRAAQNPVASMISVPFQNNMNFGVGPYGKQQNVTNIQPVVPFRINEDWNLITRWVTPIISQPQLTPTGEREFGLGNIQPTFFLSPAKAGEIIWGVGPVLWLPTASDKTLGVNKWGGGPSAVALTIQGQWVFGVLVNNIWAGSGAQRVNQMLVNPFVNYNLPGGWYLTSSPVITANWLAQSGEKWTVPIGGGFGRLFRVEGQPLNLSLQAFYNVVKPTFGPEWSLRAQVQLLFPAR